jgi:hypothetical protein
MPYFGGDTIFEDELIERGAEIIGLANNKIWS